MIFIQILSHKYQNYFNFDKYKEIINSDFFLKKKEFIYLESSHQEYLKMSALYRPSRSVIYISLFQTAHSSGLTGGGGSIPCRKGMLNTAENLPFMQVRSDIIYICILMYIYAHKKL